MTLPTSITIVITVLTQSIILLFTRKWKFNKLFYNLTYQSTEQGLKLVNPMSLTADPSQVQQSRNYNVQKSSNFEIFISQSCYSDIHWYWRRSAAQRLGIRPFLCTYICFKYRVLAECPPSSMPVRFSLNGGAFSV